MKELIGDLSAYIPASSAGGKANYVRIGVAFKEAGSEKISFKIDSLPLANSGWTGWVNVYTRSAPAANPAQGVKFEEDEIPF